MPSAVTIVDSSHTVPHLTQTASPELSFKSMSVLRHSGFEQRIWDILAVVDFHWRSGVWFRPRRFEKKKPTCALWRSEKQIPQ